MVEEPPAEAANAPSPKVLTPEVSLVLSSRLQHGLESLCAVFSDLCYHSTNVHDHTTFIAPSTFRDVCSFILKPYSLRST